MKAADVMADIVDRLITEIENGAKEWRMPWNTATGLPHNAVTGNAYRGANILALWVEGLMCGYTSNGWATYKQWQSIDAQVRKGQTGTRLIRWVEKQRNDDTADTSNSDDDKSGARLIPVSFSVFNIAQCDTATTTVTVDPTPRHEGNFAHFFDAIPAVIRWGAGQPCYRPDLDEVCMPEWEAFHTTAAGHATLAHELAHWTGHASRLDRDLTGTVRRRRLRRRRTHCGDVSSVHVRRGRHRPSDPRRPRPLPRPLAPNPQGRTPPPVVRCLDRPSRHRPPRHLLGSGHSAAGRVNRCWSGSSTPPEPDDARSGSPSPSLPQRCATTRPSPSTTPTSRATDGDSTDAARSSPTATRHPPSSTRTQTYRAGSLASSRPPHHCCRAKEPTIMNTTPTTTTTVIDVDIDLIDRDEHNRAVVLDAAFATSIATPRDLAARARRPHRRRPLPADRR